MDNYSDPSVGGRQSVERGSGTQADHSGPQRQTGRSGVDAGKTGGHWRNQLASGKKRQIEDFYFMHQHSNCSALNRVHV